MVTKMEVKAYIGAVKKVLWHVPERRKVAKELQNEVEGYLEQNADATMADVYTVFGTPEAIKAALIADIQPEVVEKKIKWAQFVRKTAIVATAVIIFLFALTMTGIIIYNYYAQPVYYYDQILP